MLTGYVILSIQIIALNIVVRHFRSKILCCNRECGQEISKWSIIFDAKTSFHIFGGMASEKDCIPFGTNTSEPLVVHATLIYILRELFF